MHWDRARLVKGHKFIVFVDDLRQSVSDRRFVPIRFVHYLVTLLNLVVDPYGLAIDCDFTISDSSNVVLTAECLELILKDLKERLIDPATLCKSLELVVVWLDESQPVAKDILTVTCIFVSFFLLVAVFFRLFVLTFA